MEILKHACTQYASGTIHPEDMELFEHDLEVIFKELDLANNALNDVQLKQ